MAQLDALDPVEHIVVPNGFHRLDAPRYKTRYPKARVYCPPGARKKSEQRIAVDGAYADYTPNASTGLTLLDGLADREGILRIASRADVTIVLNDAVLNMPHATGYSGWMLRAVTSASGGRV